MKVVAVSDKSGGIYNPKGLEIRDVLQRTCAAPLPRGTIKEAEHISNDELLTLDCEVLVPAALENVITSQNAGAHQGADHLRRRQRARPPRMPTRSWRRRASS